MSTREASAAMALLQAAQSLDVWSAKERKYQVEEQGMRSFPIENSSFSNRGNIDFSTRKRRMVPSAYNAVPRKRPVWMQTVGKNYSERSSWFDHKKGMFPNFDSQKQIIVNPMGMESYSNQPREYYEMMQYEDGGNRKSMSMNPHMVRSAKIMPNRATHTGYADESSSGKNTPTQSHIRMGRRLVNIHGSSKISPERRARLHKNIGLSPAMMSTVPMSSSIPRKRMKTSSHTHSSSSGSTRTMNALTSGVPSNSTGTISMGASRSDRESGSPSDDTEKAVGRSNGRENVSLDRVRSGNNGSSDTTTSDSGASDSKVISVERILKSSGKLDKDINFRKSLLKGKESNPRWETLTSRERIDRNLQVLKRIGANVDKACQIQCLYQNLSTVSLEDIMSEKHVCRACMKTLSVASIICSGNVLHCDGIISGTRCTQVHSFSFCRGVVHSPDIGALRHCEICKKCMSFPSKHCNKCGDCYVTSFSHLDASCPCKDKEGKLVIDDGCQIS